MKTTNKKMEKMIIDELLNEYENEMSETKEAKELLINRIYSIVDYISTTWESAMEECDRYLTDLYRWGMQLDEAIDEFIVKLIEEGRIKSFPRRISSEYKMMEKAYYRLHPYEQTHHQMGLEEDYRREKRDKTFERCVNAIRRVRNIVRNCGLEEEIGFLRF